MRDLKAVYISLGIAVAVLGGAQDAHAQQRPLTLFELEAFSRVLYCEQNGQNCDAPLSSWEKNQAGDTTGEDFDLAFLEYWDEQKLDYICYKERIQEPNDEATEPYDDEHEFNEVTLEECDGKCRISPIERWCPSSTVCWPRMFITVVRKLRTISARPLFRKTSADGTKSRTKHSW